MTPDNAAKTHYYVYYRVRQDAEREDAHATVRSMQAALARSTGVEGRLMERYGDDVTWMEVYESVVDPQAFEAAMRVETERHALGELVEPGSARHVERFVECA